jgi:hypothetical protein
MFGFKREVTSVTIDALKRDNRMAHVAGRLSIEERTRRALEKGERLLVEARRAAKREG